MPESSIVKAMLAISLRSSNSTFDAKLEAWIIASEAGVKDAEFMTLQQRIVELGQAGIDLATREQVAEHIKAVFSETKNMNAAAKKLFIDREHLKMVLGQIKPLEKFSSQQVKIMIDTGAINPVLPYKDDIPTVEAVTRGRLRCKRA